MNKKEIPTLDSNFENVSHDKNFEGRTETIDVQNETSQNVENVLDTEKEPTSLKEVDYVQTKGEKDSEIKFSQKSHDSEQLPKNIVFRTTSDSQKNAVPKLIKNSAGGAVFGVTAGILVLLLTGGVLSLPALATFGGVGALGGAVGGALIRLMKGQK